VDCFTPFGKKFGILSHTFSTTGAETALHTSDAAVVKMLTKSSQNTGYSASHLPSLEELNSLALNLLFVPFEGAALLILHAGLFVGLGEESKSMKSSMLSAISTGNPKFHFLQT
jgi:hypothetical protein